MPGSDDPSAYEAIAAISTHPVVIVTAASDDERAGCIVGFHTSCSIDPVRHLVCLSTANRTFEVAQRASTLVVHHITEDQVALARLFGEETGHDIDKFARCRWEAGPDDVPVLTGVESWWAGRIVKRVPLGDHVGYVLEPFTGRCGHPHPPFTSAAAAAFEPGHPRG